MSDLFANILAFACPISVLLIIIASAMMAIRDQRHITRMKVIIRDVLRQITMEEAREHAVRWLEQTSSFEVRHRTPGTTPKLSKRLPNGLRRFFTRYESVSSEDAAFRIHTDSIASVSHHGDYVRIGKDGEKITIAIKPHQETVYLLGADPRADDATVFPSIYHYFLDFALTFEEITPGDLIPGYLPPTRRRLPR